jgi:uncharacterized protein
MRLCYKKLERKWYSMNDVQIRYAVGTGGRFIGVRILPNTDLILGLKMLCKEVGIKSGAVISCVGTMSEATFIYTLPQPKGTSDPDNPVNIAIEAKYGFKTSPIVNVPGPLDIVALEGTIMFTEGQEDDQRLHLHGIVIDQFGKFYGGHFLEGGNPALATLDMVLCATEGVRMICKPDIDFAGLPMLCPDNK